MNRQDGYILSFVAKGGGGTTLRVSQFKLTQSARYRHQPGTSPGYLEYTPSPSQIGSHSSADPIRIPLDRLLAIMVEDAGNPGPYTLTTTELADKARLAEERNLARQNERHLMRGRVSAGLSTIFSEMFSYGASSRPLTFGEAAEMQDKILDLIEPRHHPERDPDATQDPTAEPDPIYLQGKGEAPRIVPDRDPIPGEDARRFERGLRESMREPWGTTVHHPPQPVQIQPRDLSEFAIDLIILLGRLEQIRQLRSQHVEDTQDEGLWGYLLDKRVIGCDLRRMRKYLSAGEQLLLDRANEPVPARTSTEPDSCPSCQSYIYKPQGCEDPRHARKMASQAYPPEKPEGAS